MQNNTPNQYQNRGFNFIELINILLASKKLIIAITLIITLLASVYSFNQKPQYTIQSIIKIGQYNKGLVLDPESIKHEIKVLFGQSIKGIGFEYLEVKHTSIDEEISTERVQAIIDHIIVLSNEEIERLINHDKNNLFTITEKIKSREKQLNRLTNLELTGYDRFIEMSVLTEKSIKTTANNEIDSNDNTEPKFDDTILNRLIKLPTSVEISITEMELELSDFKATQKILTDKLKLADHWRPTSVIGGITSTATNKRMLMNTFSGFIIGFFLSLMFLLIKHSLPKSIKSRT